MGGRMGGGGVYIAGFLRSERKDRDRLQNVNRKRINRHEGKREREGWIIPLFLFPLSS